MKPELTPELKECFFVQYWGQKVFFTREGRVWFVDVGNMKYGPILGDSLLLRPLSSITDDEAIEFFDIVWANVGVHKDKPIAFKIDFGKDWALSPTSERYGLIPTGLFHGVDHLRSKGFALPFMGHSVEDLISAGWVKLVEP